MNLNKYLVFSRDPGGAEILSRYIKNEKNQDICLFILEGPAKSIFLSVLENIECVDLENAESLFSLYNIQKIFCSTSGHTGPEKEALRLGQLFKVETVAVIDHWTNFQERFLYQKNNFIILPQIILYTDNIQLKLLNTFIAEETQLIKIPNYYLEELKQDFDSKTEDQIKSNVLFLDEPLRDDAKEMNLVDHGYDEYSAFNFFLKNIEKAASQFEKIIIRLHPRSAKNKYNEIISKSKFNIQYSTNSNLVDDLITSKATFGCTTMALIVSSYCNVETFSTIPINGISHGLPNEKIKYLRDLK